MEAKELRIGNLVFAPQNGFNKSVVYKIADGYDIDNVVSFTAIPTTKEWLIKFGFEKDKDEIYFLDAWPPKFPSQRFVIEYTKTGGFTLRSRYEPYNGGHTFCLLEYVHQLQNLYFCLCGKELECSP